MCDVQVSVHRMADDPTNRHVVVMKGAPERIIERSSTILINGEEVCH